MLDERGLSNSFMYVTLEYIIRFTSVFRLSIVILQGYKGLYCDIHLLCAELRVVTFVSLSCQSCISAHTELDQLLVCLHNSESVDESFGFLMFFWLLSLNP